METGQQSNPVTGHLSQECSTRTPAAAPLEDDFGCADKDDVSGYNSNGGLPKAPDRPQKDDCFIPGCMLPKRCLVPRSTAFDEMFRCYVMEALRPE